MISSTKINSQKYSINLSNEPKGTYLFEIFNEDKLARVVLQ